MRSEGSSYEDETCAFLGFHSGVAEDYVIIRYDAASLGNPRRFVAVQCHLQGPKCPSMTAS
jgi:hypothetical protein